MIPDKIYVPTEYTDNDITPVGVTLQQVFPNDVCYIRKDALMEWLESKVYEHNEDRFDDGFNAALGQVIDKLNEM